MQAEKEKDDAKKLAEKNMDTQCFSSHEERSRRPFVDRKQTAAITDDVFTSAVIEGISNMASSSRNCVFAVTEKPSLGNHAVRWKRSCQRSQKPMHHGSSLIPDRRWLHAHRRSLVTQIINNLRASCFVIRFCRCVWRNKKREDGKGS